ncbi:hypothetical protein LguiA_005134 [Lonicera macranthoides]
MKFIAKYRGFSDLSFVANKDHKSYDPNMISGVSRVDIIVLKHTLVSIFRGRLIEDAGNVKVGRDLHNATISLSFRHIC